VRPREFSEVQALYSSPMTDTFSGGVMYEYSQETNDYGLVAIDSTEGNRVELSEYQLFKRVLANVSDIQQVISFIE
jgi:hypothetical protein